MLLPPCSLRALARAPPPRSESESGSLQAPQCAYRDRSMPLPPHSLRCCGFRTPPCRSTAADCAQTQIMSLPPHGSLCSGSGGCSQAPSESLAPQPEVVLLVDY
jgi:hypothetical protein